VGRLADEDVDLAADFVCDGGLGDSRRGGGGRRSGGTGGEAGMTVVLGVVGRGVVVCDDMRDVRTDAEVKRGRRNDERPKPVPEVRLLLPEW
jgi:hypothetical protein